MSNKDHIGREDRFTSTAAFNSARTSFVGDLAHGLMTLAPKVFADLRNLCHLNNHDPHGYTEPKSKIQ